MIGPEAVHACRSEANQKVTAEACFFGSCPALPVFGKAGPVRLSWPLSIALVAIALAQLTIQYLLNYWNRDFFNALERHDGALLWNEALIFIPLACSNIALAVVSVWGRMTMQRKWRQWLTTHLLTSWLKKYRYRRLQFVSGEYQNAEYRISFDARIATDAPVDLVFGLLTSALTAIVFIHVLWSVGGSLTVVLSGHELTVPAYLVVGVVVYSTAFTAIMIAVGRNLTSVIQGENQAKRSYGRQPTISAKSVKEHRRLRPGRKTTTVFGTRCARSFCVGVNCAGN